MVYTWYVVRTTAAVEWTRDGFTKHLNTLEEEADIDRQDFH